MGSFIKCICLTFFALFLMLPSVTYAKDIIVSAAASLNEAFQQIGKNFEKENPKNKISFNFAASGTLLQQMKNGAPVDVFASADEATMKKALDLQLIDPKTSVIFTKNNLVLIEPKNHSIPIQKLQDLELGTIQKIAIGNPAFVPAGYYTHLALNSMQLWDKLQPKFIMTQSVRQTLDYVGRAEVDAGFVYGSDAAIMPNKVKIVMNVSVPQAITYPIAITTYSKSKDLAQRFIDYVVSPQGQQVLSHYGFQKR
ncbi:Molybdate-binding protein ModA [Commensalibacter sp. Nvir]|uniref:molybdate ABC transporter substrate-binding protein n=1 Tax=Commensalibacter sp. Nvir TaxID=3069817 RepID=UPI002D28F8B1|nr:Molybdate-binding protein ModA [Commensalibacter sp. Nvir]